MNHRRLSSFPRLPESPVSSAANAQDLIMPTLSLASAAPPPPPTPHPWLWKCHSCHMVYKLGCTRRCIECDHIMCTSRDVAIAKLEAAMGSSSSRHGGKKRRRRRRGPCVSEFDFAGWKAWAAWRRGLQSRQGQDREREQRLADRKHSCSDDCSYPSECHHTRLRLLREQQEWSIAQWIAEQYGSTGPDFLSPKTRVPATTAMTVSPDEEMQRKSDEASLAVATGEFYIELPDETGHDDDGEAEEILSSSVVMVVDQEETHSLDDSDNDSDDSDDSDPHDTGLTTTLAQSNSWPLPAARDQLSFTMLGGGNNNSSSSSSFSSSATPEDEVMHDIPPSPSPGDEGYDSDIDDEDDDDDGYDEDDDPSYLAVADRQQRSQRKLYSLAGSDAFLPLSRQPTSAAAPSRHPRDRHCYQLPSLAEEEEDDDDDDDDDEDEDSEMNWPSEPSPSPSPLTTRSSSRASGGGGAVKAATWIFGCGDDDDDDDDDDDGRAPRWSPREPAAGSTNEDIAELMRFRSAFMRGEL